MKQGTKKLIKAVTVAGTAATAAYLTVGNVFYYLTLTKRGLNGSINEKLTNPNKPGQEYTDYLNGLMAVGAKWFDEADKEKIVIRSAHFKKNLHADYIFADKKSDLCVILVHGYTSSPRNMGVYAQKYHEMGYNVLMPSLNGHADSEAGIVTMGWDDRLDVADWAEYLNENSPDVKVVIHGVSMGAATTMMATGETLPQNVKAAVADCGYTSVWDIFSNKLNKAMGLPNFPILYSANTVNKAISHYDFRKASSCEQLKKSKTPTIFIHGEDDDFVPYAMLDEVYNACAAEKDKVSIPKGPHARNACVDPELYWNSIFKFLNKYL